MKKEFENRYVEYLDSLQNEFLTAYEKEVAMCSRTKNIGDILYSVQVNGDFERLCDAELDNGKTMLDQFPNVVALLTGIYVERHAHSIIQQSYPVYNSFANQAITSISYLKNNMQGMWLFKPHNVKVELNSTYSFFSSDYYFEQKKYLEQITTQLNSIRTVSISQVLADFYGNIKIYENIAQKCNVGVFNNYKTINSLFNALKEYNVIDEIITKISNDSKTSEEKVKQAVEFYKDEKTTEDLEKMTLSSLKQRGDGLKLSVLEQNGITTAADLYSSRGYLSLLSGIGYKTAKTMSDYAKVLYNDSRDNVRVKLNIDDHSWESRQLLEAIYNCLKTRRILESVKRVWNQYGTEINNNYKNLRSIKNGLTWLFLSSAEKHNYKRMYNYLYNQLQGDYIREITPILNEYKKLEETTDEEINEDFLKHTVTYINLLEELCGDSIFQKHESYSYESQSQSSEYYESPSINENINDDTPKINEKIVYGLPERLANKIDCEKITLDGLKCELRKYQMWGVKFILHQKQVLLGDEMGLGKTIQAIAAIVSLRNAGGTHFMVVCPASVLQNWTMEIEDKCDLDVVQLYGSSRKYILVDWLSSGGVAVTTYESLKDLNIPEGFVIDLLVVDEAHYIKNPNAQRTKNVQRIMQSSSRKLLMTGTALENRKEELIFLASLLDPKITYRLKLNINSPNKFKNIIMPVYYRRKRDDVLHELPELIENYEWCSMEGKEEKKYEETVLSKNYMSMRRLSWNVDDLKESSKAKRLKEIIDEATEDNRKIIIFSFFLDTLNKLHDFFKERSLQPINGSVPPAQRQEIIKEFDEAPYGSILLAQIQTGGTGLNIQSASVVIICEPQYKPSTENQAISRAYRMGQTRNVFVHRMLCKNTIDERITKILKNKQQIFDDYADESYSANKDSVRMKQEEITEARFKEIAEEEYQRVLKKVSGGN